MGSENTLPALAAKALGILGPRETRELLETLGHFPRRQLGQNFLVDGNLVRKALKMGEVSPGDEIVEVGPGLGTLTGALLGAGARVFAVELDPVLARHLRGYGVSSGEVDSMFHLLEGDAVEYPLAGWPSLKEMQVTKAERVSRLKVIANLPYAVSTPWLEAVLAGDHRPSRMVVMLQKEAAQRYCSQPGSKSFGAISIFLQSAYRVVGQHGVSRTCFYPVPDVDSVLLRLDLRSSPYYFAEEDRNRIRQIFTQRRKQIGALVRAIPEARGWLDYLDKNQISLASRPEQLGVEIWQGMVSEGGSDSSVI